MVFLAIKLILTFFSSLPPPDVTSETLSKCFGASIGLSYSHPEADVTIGGQASYKKCSKTGDQATGRNQMHIFKVLLPLNIGNG